MKFRLVGTTVPAVEVFFEQAGEEMITSLVECRGCQRE